MTLTFKVKVIQGHTRQRTLNYNSNEVYISDLLHLLPKDKVTTSTLLYSFDQFSEGQK
jgi:hypothetical protein